MRLVALVVPEGASGLYASFACIGILLLYAAATDEEAEEEEKKKKKKMKTKKKKKGTRLECASAIDQMLHTFSNYKPQRQLYFKLKLKLRLKVQLNVYIVIWFSFGYVGTFKFQLEEKERERVWQIPKSRSAPFATFATKRDAPD